MSQKKKEKIEYNTVKLVKDREILKYNLFIDEIYHIDAKQQLLNKSFKNKTR